MTVSRYIIGDTRAVTASLPDASVDLILTSPPFLALHSYLPADHPDKRHEIGSEATPAEYIDTLLDLTARCDRVLAPHGSICVELGDTYSGSGGGGGDYLPGGMREGQQQFAGSAASMRESNAAHWRIKNAQRDAWPLDKCKTLIPEMYRIALAYGINPLTGQASPAGRWRVRNVVTWCRPNPPVGALGDKYRPATSDLVIATRAKDRYFDLNAVRDGQRTSEKTEGPAPKSTQFRQAGVNGFGADQRFHARGGAPPLDYWVIPPGGYSGAHYAVYPPELCRIPIVSMCPRRVCTVCGEPSRRIVDTSYAVNREGGTSGKRRDATEPDGNNRGMIGKPVMSAVVETTGWTDCGHDSWRRGVVLDPFGGSGTTAMVANGLGRDAILIDIDPRNIDLARERCGMFLQIETPEAA